MNEEHKKAFRQLRQLCEDFNMEIFSDPDSNEVMFIFKTEKYGTKAEHEYSAELSFDKKDHSVILLGEMFSEDEIFNFMEKEK